ncbi:hypothetical protein ACFL3T_02475 [Patescibacteria group bacterium]
MDKNYFSDITELFIKAKKAENIDVNPHSKAAIREMLAYKVDEIKSAEEAPEKGFFSKWKFQLVGVPASVFAVFMVVFAFQNLQITMPKEDFAPTTASEVATSESIFGETELTEDVDTPVIEDLPTEVKESKPKPELLVINYGETTKTGGGYVPPSYTQPVVQPVETTVESAVEPVPTHKPYVAPVSTPTYIAPDKQTEEKETTTKPGVSTGGAFSVYTPTESNDTYTPPATEYTAPQTAPTFDIYTPTTENGYTMISDDSLDLGEIPRIPLPEVDIPQYDFNPNDVNSMMDGNIPLPKTNAPEEGGTVNEFRNPFNPLVHTFDAEALNTIEKPDTLDNVNVHYLNRDQAAVEVNDDDGSTRWYMFEDRGGSWTVTQKFD